MPTGTETKELQLKISREISTLAALLNNAATRPSMSLLSLRDVNSEFLRHAEMLVQTCKDMDEMLDHMIRREIASR